MGPHLPAVKWVSDRKKTKYSPWTMSAHWSPCPRKHGPQLSMPEMTRKQAGSIAQHAQHVQRSWIRHCDLQIKLDIYMAQCFVLQILKGFETRCPEYVPIEFGRVLRRERFGWSEKSWATFQTSKTSQKRLEISYNGKIISQTSPETPQVWSEM